jgi:hypothetical protein
MTLEKDVKNGLKNARKKHKKEPLLRGGINL